MMEPDFVTDEELEKTDEQKTYKIELSIWLFVICLIVFWMITNKIALHVTGALMKYLQPGSSANEDEILDQRWSQLAWYLCLMSMTDFVLSSLLLFGALLYYLQVGLIGLSTKPERITMCQNVEFSLLLCALFIIACDMIKQLILGLSSKFISKTVVCAWTIGILVVITLYRRVLPQSSVPIVEIYLNERETYVDLVVLLLLTIIVVPVVVLNTRSWSRLCGTDRTFIHLNQQPLMQRNSHLDNSNIIQEKKHINGKFLTKE